MKKVRDWCAGEGGLTAYDEFIAKVKKMKF